MAVTSRQFWQRLIDLGLASEGECHAWALEILQKLGKDRIDDPGIIAKALLQAGRLTRYQAQLLLQESEPRLRYGHFLIHGPSEHSLFVGWLRAVNPSCQANLTFARRKRLPRALMMELVYWNWRSDMPRSIRLS